MINKKRDVFKDYNITEAIKRLSAKKFRNLLDVL